MKKIALTLILLFTLVRLAFGQITYNKVFQLDTQTYFPTTLFYDVEQDDKFIYILGEYRDYNNNGIYKATSFVLTLDQSGNILHQTDFKPRATYSNLVPIDNDGFALVASNFTDSLFLLKVYPLSDTVVTIKKSMNTMPSTCNFRRLSITNDKHFLVAGSVHSSNPNYGIGEIYMKLDSLGNTIWKKDSMSYYPESRYTNRLIELTSGNYLLLGTRRHKSYGFSTFESQGYFKILDTSGTIISTTYTDNNRLLGLGYTLPLDNGEILFGGRERLTSDLYSYDMEYRGYICKYDSTGLLLWDYSLDKDEDWIGRFAILQDGSCIVPGVRTDSIPSTVVSGYTINTQRHGFLLKLAPDGTKLWERRFTALDSIFNAERSFYSVIQATNGDFIIVGRLLYSVNQKTKEAGWLVRTDSFGCIVPGCQILDNTENQTFDDINQLTVFPNPTSDLITFRFEKPLNDSSIRVFNSLGQELKTQQIADNEEQINCSNWQNGLYFYGIYENNRLVKTGQFLKQ